MINPQQASSTMRGNHQDGLVKVLSQPVHDRLLSGLRGRGKVDDFDAHRGLDQFTAKNHIQFAGGGRASLASCSRRLEVAPALPGLRPRLLLLAGNRRTRRAPYFERQDCER